MAYTIDAYGQQRAVSPSTGKTENVWAKTTHPLAAAAASLAADPIKKENSKSGGAGKTSGGAGKTSGSAGKTSGSTGKTSGGSGSASAASGRSDAYYAALLNAKKSKAAAIRDAEHDLSESLISLDERRGELADEYNDSARSAYLSLLLDLDALPEQMSAAGLRGSGQVQRQRQKLQSGYGQAVDELLTAYQRSRDALDRDEAAARRAARYRTDEAEQSYSARLERLARQYA